MPRKATTLVEVLIAIFIMALGLVALLTLFPLGLLQMARSFHDERAAQVAANAAANFRVMWKNMGESWSAPGTGNLMYADGWSLNTFCAAMDDPNLYLSDDNPIALMPMFSNPSQITKLLVNPVINAPEFPPSITTMRFPTAMMDKAKQRMLDQSIAMRGSYPVFIDPIGWEAGVGTPRQMWLGYVNQQTYAIPRRRISKIVQYPTIKASANTLLSAYAPTFPSYRQMAIRNQVMADDIGFDNQGQGIPSERQGQFSCAYLVKRDQNSMRSDASLTVVVYFKRSSETLTNESVFVGSTPPGTTGGSVLTISNSPTEKPAVRKGGWILDATMESVPSSSGAWIDCHARYYRVTDIIEDTGSAVVVQLDRPLKPVRNPNTPRRIIIQESVYEVFEKGPMDMNSSSRMN